MFDRGCRGSLTCCDEFCEIMSSRRSSTNGRYRRPAHASSRTQTTQSPYSNVELRVHTTRVHISFLTIN